MTIVSGEVVPASPKTPIRGVKFIGENERWAAVSDQGELELGMKRGMPAAWRLEHLAISRMNKYGHAPFVSGELADMLGVQGDTVKTILRTYKQNGIIARESSQLCIVLSAERTQRADGMADILCADPMHAKKGLRDLMWSHNFGWEPEPNYLRTILGDEKRLTELRGRLTDARGEVSAERISVKGKGKIVRETIEFDGEAEIARAETIAPLIPAPAVTVDEATRPTCPKCRVRVLADMRDEGWWCSGCVVQFDNANRAVA